MMIKHIITNTLNFFYKTNDQMYSGKVKKYLYFGTEVALHSIPAIAFQ
jgi:hypothetical protein